MNAERPDLERCRCTIHEDRDEPCGFRAPLDDYRDPTDLVCDTCYRVCWGVGL